MFKKTGGIVFDLPLGKNLVETEALSVDRNSKVRAAVAKADRMAENRTISQDLARELESELPVEDRYAFHMALVDADIRVRTGAVNVVDREEPVVRGLGDASVNPTNLWSIPSIPRDELNTSPNATMELESGKPRRSEGEKHTGFGNNLTDLTMLASLKIVQENKLKSAEVVSMPPSLVGSEAARWNKSYSDENQFEDTNKLGTSELGECPHCQSAEGSCKQCVCASRSKTWSFSVKAVSLWQKRAARVQRKMLFGEVPVWIEYEVGDIKRGKNREGKAWEQKMQSAYGFIPGSIGADGEPVDVYLGGNPSRKVFVIFQMSPGGGFDEEKVMLGYPNAQQAEAMYRAHMPSGGKGYFGGIREMSVGEFEDEYIHAHRKGQFSVTGQLVPNPNPEGKKEMVTEDYAQQWKDEQVPQTKSLSNVDTSKAVSPIAQEDARDTGKAKELATQFWRLLGGPGFNPYKTSVLDLHRLAKRVVAESYSQPDHGPLGTDGEVDHPEEDMVVHHANL